MIVPDQRHYAGGVVMVAPPPPREEVIGVAPEPGYVWLNGYWSWAAIATFGFRGIGPRRGPDGTGWPINGFDKAMAGG